MSEREKTSPLAWVAIGCSVLVVGVAGFIAFILLVTFGSMRASEPYKGSVAQAKSDPRVVAALGNPVKPGYLFAGSINTSNGDGRAEFTIPLHGPKGGGMLTVKADKKRGTWRYDEMKVTVKNQEIDLLKTSP